MRKNINQYAPSHSTLIPVKDLNDQVSHLENEVNDYRALVDTLSRKNDIQDALNKVLLVSLEATSLEEQLEKILILILSIKWLALAKKGAIFLTDSEDSLKLITSQNLGESLLTMCEKVKYGQCLCGKAAQRQEIIFKNCLDEDHDNLPQGITEHGHYIIPFLWNGETTGVLNLYVKHGHLQTSDEVSFLESCSNIISGIIQRKAIEEKISFLSLHDDLTNLPNRRHLISEIEGLIKQAKRLGNKFSILFIDLDYFKSVNDTFGHKFGDLVLIEVAQRLKDCLRELDFVARNGGDEFIVILQDVTDNLGIKEVGNKIIETLEQTYMIEGNEIHIGASIGVSIYPDSVNQQNDIDGLIQLADKALYGAKTNRGTVVITE